MGGLRDAANRGQGRYSREDFLKDVASGSGGGVPPEETGDFLVTLPDGTRRAMYAVTPVRLAAPALRAALMRLNRSPSTSEPCWCEMAAGNPNVPGHSAACLMAREAIAAAGG